jgi:hypothetical protein
MKTKEEIENICGNIVDSESINDQYKQSVYEGCVLGYTQCQEDIVEKYTEQDMIKFAFDTYYQEDMSKKYTEEDMLKAFEKGALYGTTKNGNTHYFDEIINSLNKQDNDK